MVSYNVVDLGGGQRLLEHGDVPDGSRPVVARAAVELAPSDRQGSARREQWSGRRLSGQLPVHVERCGAGLCVVDAGQMGPRTARRGRVTFDDDGVLHAGDILRLRREQPLTLIADRQCRRVTVFAQQTDGRNERGPLCVVHPCRQREGLRRVDRRRTRRDRVPCVAVERHRISGCVERARSTPRRSPRIERNRRRPTPIRSRRRRW